MPGIIKESARDFLALGSWVFYILVIARALIGPYWEFAFQMTAAGVIVLIAEIFIKDAEYYLARGFILVVFTALFYNTLIYTIFAVLAFFGLIISSSYIGNKEKIFFGILIGALSSIVSYYIIGFLNF